MTEGRWETEHVTLKYGNYNISHLTNIIGSILSHQYNRYNSLETKINNNKYKENCPCHICSSWINEWHNEMGEDTSNVWRSLELSQDKFLSLRRVQFYGHIVFSPTKSLELIQTEMNSHGKREWRNGLTVVYVPYLGL